MTIEPNGDSPDYTVAYDYDSMGRLTTVTGPGVTAGGAVYSFLVDGSTPVSDLVGQIAFRGTGGTTTIARTTRNFDGHRDLIVKIENRWISGTESVVSYYEYANDDLGRRINVVNTGTAFQSGGRNTVFAYDDRSQLTESHRREGTTPGSGTQVLYQQYGFAFDFIGNRTGYTGDDHPEFVKEYFTNELNQYTETANPAETFTHDEDGNLIEDGDFYYIWDAENRLIGVTPVNPGTRQKRVEFAYDYMGRRIRKLVFGWNQVAEDWEVEPELDLRFVYDGWNLVQEIAGGVTGSGVTEVSREYTWGLDLSGQSGNPGVVGIHGAGINRDSHQFTDV